MKVSVCLFALVAAVLAEPPAPNSQYLPPNKQYGAPNGNGVGRNGNGNGGAPQRPGQQYGAPQPSPQYGAPNGNGDEDAPASYSFEYKVEDAESGNDFGHMESREGDVAQGKYYVLLPDGRKQIVEYTADSDGYHPMVTYEGEANGGNGNGNGNGGGYPASNGGYPSGNGNGNGNGNGQRGNGGYNY